MGEVGKNMMVYQYGEDCLVVDAGMMFPENDMLGWIILFQTSNFTRQR